MAGNMETTTVVLPEDEWVLIPGHGDKVFILDANAPLSFEFFRPDGTKLGYANGIEVGDGGGPGPLFRSLRVKSATAQTVKLAITGGSFTVSRVAGSVSVLSPSSLVDAEDNALVADTNEQIFAATTTAAERLVKVAAASAASVRVGSTNISATRGILLEAGQTLVLTTAAAVFARSIGDAATVQLLETVGG